MTPASWLAELLAAEPRLRSPLQAVAVPGLPDAWIGAGFVRNAAWDALSGLPFGSNPPGDIDVVWFDAARTDTAEDRAAEAALRALLPALPWSVTNQARMAARNGDAPYAGTRDAAARWPETATAVLARWTGEAVEVAAPWGLDDLLGRVLRPTPGFALGSPKHAGFLARCRARRWVERWPGVRIVAR